MIECPWGQLHHAVVKFPSGGLKEFLEKCGQINSESQIILTLFYIFWFEIDPKLMFEKKGQPQKNLNVEARNSLK